MENISKLWLGDTQFIRDISINQKYPITHGFITGLIQKRIKDEQFIHQSSLFSSHTQTIYSSFLFNVLSQLKNDSKRCESPLCWALALVCTFVHLVVGVFSPLNMVIHRFLLLSHAGTFFFLLLCLLLLLHNAMTCYTQSEMSHSILFFPVSLKSFTERTILQWGYFHSAHFWSERDVHLWFVSLEGREKGGGKKATN